MNGFKLTIIAVAFALTGCITAAPATTPAQQTTDEFYWRAAICVAENSDAAGAHMFMSVGVRSIYDPTLTDVEGKVFMAWAYQMLLACDLSPTEIRLGIKNEMVMAYIGYALAAKYPALAEEIVKKYKTGDT